MSYLVVALTDCTSNISDAHYLGQKVVVADIQDLKGSNIARIILASARQRLEGLDGGKRAHVGLAEVQLFQFAVCL